MRRGLESCVAGFYLAVGLSVAAITGETEPEERRKELDGVPAGSDGRKIGPQTPPYGYRTRRVGGRSTVEVDPERAARVRRVFDLYAFHGQTLDSLIEQLDSEGTVYTDATRRFPRTKLHDILRDRSYLGEVRFHGQWHPGTHEPLIDASTFARVRSLMRGCTYKAHDLTYAGELIACGHCGAPITGEEKTKATKKHGERRYRYYRCTKYTKPGTHE